MFLKSLHPVVSKAYKCKFWGYHGNDDSSRGLPGCDASQPTRPLLKAYNHSQIF